MEAKCYQAGPFATATNDKFPMFRHLHVTPKTNSVTSDAIMMCGPYCTTVLYIAHIKTALKWQVDNT